MCVCVHVCSPHACIHYTDLLFKELRHQSINNILPCAMMSEFLKSTCSVANGFLFIYIRGTV